MPNLFGFGKNGAVKRMEHDEKEPNPERAATNSTSSSPPAKTFWSSFFEKAAATGRLAAKEAQRRKLQSVDLRKADQEIGRKAFDSDAVPSEFAESVSKLRELREQMTVLRQPETAASDSFGDKAKAAANAATKKARLEALKLKESSILSDLGAKIRNRTEPVSSLGSEISAANTINDRIKSVEGEIENLRGGSWVKRPLLLVSVALIFILLFFGLRSLRNRGHVYAASDHSVAAEMERYERDQKEAAAQAERARQSQLDSVKQIMASSETAQREYAEKEKQRQADQDKAEQLRQDQERKSEEAARQQEEERKHLEAEASRQREQQAAAAAQEAAKPVATPELIARANVPWTNEKDARNYVFLGDQIWDVVNDKAAGTKVRLYSGEPRLVANHPNVIFTAEKEGGFGFASPPHLTIPGTDVVISPIPNDSSSSEKGITRIASDFRRLVIEENGDLWRAEFDWANNSVVNKKRLTSNGLFSHKEAVLWSGNNLYVKGYFSKEKPIVKIDLVTGALEEIPTYGVFDKSMFVNPTADFVFYPDGEILRTYDARTGKAGMVRNRVDARRNARQELINVLTPYSKLAWVDPNTFVCLNSSGQGEVVVKMNVRTGQTVLLDQKEGHFTELHLLPGEKVAELQYFLDRYNAKVEPMCYLVSIADGSQTKVPYSPDMRRNWLDGDRCIYGNRGGGINQVGTWLFDRRTGQTKKLCSIPCDSSFAMLLPDRDEICFSASTNGQHLCRVKLDGQDFVQLSCGEYAHAFTKVPVDLGLGSSAQSLWQTASSINKLPVADTKPQISADKPGDWFVVLDALKNEPPEIQEWAKNTYDYAVSNMILGNFYDPAKLTLKLLSLHRKAPEKSFGILVMDADYKECAFRPSIERWAYHRAFDIVRDLPPDQLERVAQETGRRMADAYMADPSPTENYIEGLYRNALTAALKSVRDKPTQSAAGRSAGIKNAVSNGDSSKATEPGVPQNDNNTDSPAQFDQQAASSFAEKEVAAMSSGSIDSLVSLYAERVDYLDKGAIATDGVRNDYQQYFDRWPQTSWQITGPINAQPMEHSRYKVTFPISFDASNPVSGKRVSGNARQTMVLGQDGTGAWKIIYERQSIVQSGKARVQAAGKHVKGERYDPNSDNARENMEEIARRLQSLFPH